MYEIRKNFTEIVPPINIGMVIGDDAIIMSEAAINQLDLAIDLIVKMIKDMGLSIEKQAPVISSVVIVDTENLLLKTEETMQRIENRMI